MHFSAENCLQHANIYIPCSCTGHLLSNFKLRYVSKEMTSKIKISFEDIVVLGFLFSPGIKIKGIQVAVMWDNLLGELERKHL